LLKVALNTITLTLTLQYITQSYVISIDYLIVHLSYNVFISKS